MKLGDEDDVKGLTIAVAALVFANMRGNEFVRSLDRTSEQLANEAFNAAEVFMAVAAERLA